MNNCKELIFDTKDEWLAARRGYICGTDIAVIMGVSPYKTIRELFDEKQGGGKEIEDTFYMRIGRESEPVIAKMYAEDNPNVKVIDPNSDGKIRCFVREIEGIPCLVSVDRIIDYGKDEIGVLECKRYSGQEPYTEEEIPIHYKLQMNWQLGVLGLNSNVLGCLANRGIAYINYVFDQELFNRQLKAAKDFFEKLKSGTTSEEAYPLPDFSVETKLVDEIKVDDPDRILKRYFEAKKKEKDGEAEAKELYNQVLSLAGSSRKITDGNYAMTLTRRKGRVGFNAKDFETAHPKLYEYFMTVGEESYSVSVKEKFVF